ncbi:MAG: tetratricopeptide repeat protein [Opitutales bacterium]
MGQGNLDYVLTACGQILRTTPGCLAARRLERMARRRQISSQGGSVGRALSRLRGLPLAFGATRHTPEENLRRAEAVLSRDPACVPALKLLAEAAQALDWPETAAFAREAIRELAPRDRANLLALGEAWLRAGRPDEALRVADEVLRLHPVDGAAQTLMRHASIARTTRQGHWEGAGDYREKLRDGEAAAARERPARQTPPEAPARADDAAPDGRPATDPLADAREQVERYPGDLAARFRLAELLFASGEIEPAIAHYQPAQRHPKHRRQAQLGLARCFRARRLTDLAVAQLAAAKAEQPAMDELRKEIVYELGACYEELRQPEAALAEFKLVYTEDIGFRDVAAKINAHYGQAAP